LPLRPLEKKNEQGPARRAPRYFVMKTDEAFYKTLLDNLYDGVYFVDKKRTVSYWNKGAERITGYTAAEVVGRRCSDDILMHVDREGNSLCLGLCPLADTMTDGKARSSDVYLQHKDGHRVHVFVRAAPIRGERGVIVGGIEIFTDNTPAAEALERFAELERLAFLDPLTGLANRRFAEITLKARLEELQRYGWRFGVIFIDIDNFKDINDRYGHDAGDEVLKMVAKTLQNSVRAFDVVSRWGGEEYVAVVAHVEGDELAATAKRCRALVEQSSLPAGKPIRVTISLGATLARQDDTMVSLIKRADALMYQSKAAGRNAVTTDIEQNA
jgi:diguanylate cyclase (GGDEF)-like protein/PAS domain S-box-containing protein